MLIKITRNDQGIESKFPGLAVCFLLVKIFFLGVINGLLRLKIKLDLGQTFHMPSHILIKSQIVMTCKRYHLLALSFYLLELDWKLEPCTSNLRFKVMLEKKA